MQYIYSKQNTMDYISYLLSFDILLSLLTSLLILFTWIINVIWILELQSKAFSKDLKNISNIAVYIFNFA